MLGELRASLYDLFGYLFPGVFVLVSLCLMLGLMTPTNSAYSLEALGKSPIAVAFLGIAYALGHLTHAAGNALPGLGQRPEDRSISELEIPTELLSVATVRLGETSPEAARLLPTQILRLLDQEMKRNGDTAEREMFVYREGFYHAMTIAALVLGIVLAAHVVVDARIGAQPRQVIKLVVAKQGLAPVAL